MYKCKCGFTLVDSVTKEENKIRKGSKWSVGESNELETNLYASINKRSYWITIPTEDFNKYFEKI